MKAGKASTAPLPIDFKKLKAFSKFSKVNLYFIISAKNPLSNLHRDSNPRKANSRAWPVIQTNRYKLRWFYNGLITEKCPGQTA